MSRYFLYGLSFVLFGLGCFATVKNLKGLDKAQVKGEDLEAKATVTSKSGTELRHKIGITLDTTYQMSYKFIAADGQTYHGTDNIDAAKFNRVNKGSQINVRYHSTNPNISSGVGFGTYISVDEMPRLTPLTKLFISLGFLVSGIGVFCANHFLVDDSPSMTRMIEDELSI